MAKFVKLNKVVSENRNDYDDELGGDTPTAPTVVSEANYVNVDLIRSFGPRKENKPGTLLIFTNASMFSVVEAMDEVNRMISLPPSRQPGRTAAAAPDQASE